LISLSILMVDKSVFVMGFYNFFEFYFVIDILYTHFYVMHYFCKQEDFIVLTKITK